MAECQSVVPSLGHENGSTRKFLLASMVCGRIGEDSLESLCALVSECELAGHTVRLRFADGERAFVQLGAPAEVEVTLNKKSWKGPIVVARVSADGSAWFVLRGDGVVDSQGAI